MDHPGSVQTIPLDDGNEVVIGPLRADHVDDLWMLFTDAVARGEGYPQTPPLTREVFEQTWIRPVTVTVGATLAGRLVGAYYLKPNQPGLGAHIANAGYIVARAVRGGGIGRMLVADSVERAPLAGFDAVQFNFVFESNPARAMYEDLGWSEIGRVPDAVPAPSGSARQPAVIYWRAVGPHATGSADIAETSGAGASGPARPGARVVDPTGGPAAGAPSAGGAPGTSPGAHRWVPGADPDRAGGAPAERPAGRPTPTSSQVAASPQVLPAPELAVSPPAPATAPIGPVVPGEGVALNGRGKLHGRTPPHAGHRTGDTARPGATAVPTTAALPTTALPTTAGDPVTAWRPPSQPTALTGDRLEARLRRDVDRILRSDGEDDLRRTIDAVLRSYTDDLP